MTKTIASVFAAVLLSGAAQGQQASSAPAAPPDPTVQTVNIAPGIYMLTGRGGNIGVSVGTDGAAIIDDKFADNAPNIRAAVALLSPKPVSFVINTHLHGDHTGGNQAFGAEGAVIIAQENVRKRLSSEGFIAFLAMKTQPAPRIALPIVTFARDVSFHLNGDDIRAFHAPNAHTDGDTVVHFVKSDVIHAGDTFFNKLYPFIDTSSGGSVAGVLAAADRVLRMADDKTRIIPGHGPLATRADLRAYRDMLAAVSGRVRSQIREGKTLEQVVASKPSAQYDEVWGKGFLAPEKFVTMLYGNLKK